MKQVCVLLTQKSRPISVALILDMLQTVNSFYVQKESKPFFSIQLISTQEDTVTGKVHDLYEPISMAEVAKTELILIPAFVSEDLQEAIRMNQVFIPWLVQQHKQGAEIASFCTGAFLLASTGLLNGKKATTHVLAASQFASCFPQVDLQQELVRTDEQGIYTSGGATSSFHLLLHLVEKFCTREMAVRTAKLFAIDMNRDSQAHFADLSAARQHQDALVLEVQQRMEKRYQETLTVEEIIKDVPASRRNFIRRFKQATGVTPIGYLQRLRVEAAKKLLEETNEKITAVMMDVGYADAKTFRQIFVRMVGLTPLAYREKFSLPRRQGTSHIETSTRLTV